MKDYQNYLNFKDAKNTMNQLNISFYQINILSQQNNIINCIINIEPEVNNIVIYLNKDDPKNQEFIAKITKFNPSPIIIPLNKKEEKEEILFNSSTLVEKRNIHLELQGGSKIITFTENKRKSCSMGLMVTKNGSDFIATAGHCAEEVPSPRLFYLESIDHINREIGPMVEFSLSRNNLGFIKNLNADNIQLRPII
ncbi:hypothetical protein C2G38_2033029 [Gigaspora rosea]|uniref:Peptidase S1 domain-containing protein n=1 Tax=Gigaspora rosea TaxID=44941 RepID=A0A397VKS9_9GLOM|nr:hypothetical protein C2G38_2033029 [Gigaspora rosea]